MIIIANEKGGVGKTTIAAYLALVIKNCGKAIDIFEIDDQARLEVLSGDIVSTIRLPDADAIADNDLALIDSLNPVFAAIISASRNNIIIDIGANHDAAFFNAANAVELDEELKSRGINVTVVIPTTAEADSDSAALKTARRTVVSLPSADIIVANMFFERRGVSMKTFVDLNVDYKALIQTAKTTLDFVSLRPRALTAFETSRLTPIEFANVDPNILAIRIGDNFLAAKSIKQQFAMHLVSVLEEIETCFRFQSSSNPQAYSRQKTWLNNERDRERTYITARSRHIPTSDLKSFLYANREDIDFTLVEAIIR